MANVADVVVCAAWLVVLGQNVLLAAVGVQRTPAARRWAMGLVLAVGLVVAGTWLEHRSGGRLATSDALVLAGTIAVVAGALVHVVARGTLGSSWSARPTDPRCLVEDGPYAVVRHPLYAGLVLLALGTMAAHTSIPTLAGGVGLLIGLTAKIPQEERALASAFGARWDAYCRRVPRLVPRLGRRA